MRTVFIHEVTHWLENTKGYNEFKEAVFESKTFRKWLNTPTDTKQARYDSLEEYRKKKVKNYGDKGNEYIDQEIIATFVGDNIFSKDMTRLVDFVNEYKGSRRKGIINFIKSIFAKFKNAISGIGKLENKFLSLVNEKVNATSEQNKNTTKNGSVKFEVKEDSNGRYVEINANQDLFEGKSIKEMQSIARKVILNEFKNKVLQVGNNSNAYVNKRSAEEYAFPANRRMDKGIKEAKLRASTELDNLLLVSEFLDNKNDDGRHPDAIGGWDDYLTVFKVNNIFFEGNVKIKITKNGRLFYDITKIRKIARNGGLTENNSVAASGNLSNNNISQNDNIVNNSISENSKNDNKFSMRDEVEQTKDLVAIHNVKENKLLEALNLGGLPSPSIAVMRNNNLGGNSDFGDISLVFYSDTIDPETNSKNNVYSSDAYTPIGVKTEYKLNSKLAMDLYSKMNELTKGSYVYKLNPANFHPDNLQNTVNSKGGSKALIEQYKNDYGMKQAFLADTAEPVKEVVKTKEKTTVSSDDKAVFDYLKDNIKSTLDEIDKTELINPRVWREKYDGKVKQAIENYYKELIPGISEDGIENIFNNSEFKATFQRKAFVRRALKYYKNGDTEVKSVEDNSATKKLIDDKVNQKKYEKWLNNLFDKVVEKKGIYNGEDFYTDNGDEKSFEETHWDYTLDNIVRAMNQQDAQGGNYLVKNIFGGSATKYNSLDEIRNDKQRLKTVNQEELETEKSRLNDKFLKISQDMTKGTNADLFTVTDTIVDGISKSKTKDEFRQYLKKELSGWANYDEKAFNQLCDIIKEIRQLPTEYFEAKPQRAVGFDEVAYAVIPDNSSDELKTRLEENGVKYIEYKNGDEQSRIDALNDDNSVRFSVDDEQKKYSYDELTSKPDMEITKMGEISKEEYNDYKNNTNLFSKDMVKIARKANNPKNTETATYLHNDDTNSDIMIAKTSFEHGAVRFDSAYINVSKNLSNILKNAIAVNELKPRENSNGTKILIGMAEYSNDYTFVRMVIDNRTQKLVNYDILYAIKKESIKKEEADILSAGLVKNNRSATSSTISISNLLENVKNVKLVNSVLSKDVCERLGIKRSDSVFKDSLKYSIDDDLNALNEKYGTIKKGVNAERDIDVPKKTSDTKITALTARSILEKGNIDGDTLEKIKQSIIDEEKSHKVYSDDTALKYAKRHLENGDAQAMWQEAVNGKATKNDIAIGSALLEMYANSTELDDSVKAEKILNITAELCEVGTRLGQAVQAFSLLKKWVV